MPLNPKTTTVDDTDPSLLSPIGKLVKAVRFVKHAHSWAPSGSGYGISSATFAELMTALEGVEQRAVGVNVVGPAEIEQLKADIKRLNMALCVADEQLKAVRACAETALNVTSGALGR